MRQRFPRLPLKTYVIKCRQSFEKNSHSQKSPYRHKPSRPAHLCASARIDRGTHCRTNALSLALARHSIRNRYCSPAAAAAFSPGRRAFRLLSRAWPHRRCMHIFRQSSRLSVSIYWRVLCANEEFLFQPTRRGFIIAFAYRTRLLIRLLIARWKRFYICMREIRYIAGDLFCVRNFWWCGFRM